MAWSSRDDADPEIVRGRTVLGAAVRRARLRHGISQRQLGEYVGMDQTTISRLETAKLKGMRFKMLARLIGILAASDSFELPDGPPRSRRWLPGERDVTQTPTACGSYAVNGHSPAHVHFERQESAYEPSRRTTDADPERRRTG